MSSLPRRLCQFSLCCVSMYRFLIVSLQSGGTFQMKLECEGVGVGGKGEGGGLSLVW